MCHSAYDYCMSQRIRDVSFVEISQATSVEEHKGPPRLYDIPSDFDKFPTVHSEEFQPEKLAEFYGDSIAGYSAITNQDGTTGIAMLKNTYVVQE